MTSSFQTIPDENMSRFIGNYPLSWIVPTSGPADALLMPVLLEQAADGRPARLVGHLPKRSEATRCFAKDGSAVFLMLGPNAYIAPDMVGTKDWAPTWNFVSVKIEAELQLDEGFTAEAVERLVAHQEKGKAEPWTVENIAHRYDRLLSAIIGFRADIRHVTPRFKTGQDENPDVYQRLKSALTGHDIADWMD